MANRFFDYNAPIKPLSNPRAVEIGANFLSEVLIFGVAAACVVGEAIRSTKSSNSKREDIEERISNLESASATAKTRIEELEALIAATKGQ